MSRQERKPKPKWEERRQHIAHFDVTKALANIQAEKAPADCLVVHCGPANPAHTPCCSSHGKPLCCKHYKHFHFVETGPNPCHE